MTALPPQRRAEDRMTYPFFFAGLAIIAAAIGLKVLQPGTSEWFILALSVLGGALLPTDRVLRIVQVWRKNGTPPPGPSA